MASFSGLNLALELGRLDLANVGSLRPSALLTIPSSSDNKRQKFVVGEPDGYATCFVLNKQLALETQWRHQVAKSNVCSLSLGGLKSVRDQVYAAAGTKICGIKKTGKEFFRFDTALAESITTLHINKLRIHVTSAHTYSVFDQDKDLYFHAVGDTINVVLPRQISSDSEYDGVLGCQDRYIRIIEGSNLQAELKVEGPVTAIAPLNLPPNVYRKFPQNSVHLVYGTENGYLGHIVIERGQKGMKHGLRMGRLRDPYRTAPAAAASSSNFSSLSPAICDDLNASFDGGSAIGSEITVITCGAFSSDSSITDDSHAQLVRAANGGGSVGTNVVVCCADGSVSVLAFDGMGELSLTPIFRCCLDERIVNLNVGKYISTTREELLLSTFSGKILVLSPEVKSMVANAKPQALATATGASAAPVASSITAGSHPVPTVAEIENAKKSVAELREEIEGLKKQVAHAKEAYAKSSVAGLVASKTQLAVKESLRLLPEEACHKVVVELEVPLDVVCLQSNVPVTMLDSTSTNANISRNVIQDADRKDGNHMIATMRCYTNVHRLEVTLLLQEGFAGAITLYVVPKLEPKRNQCVVFQVQPLCLHEIVDGPPPEKVEEREDMSSLALSGDFTLMQMHGWLALFLPGVPSRTASDTTCALHLRSTYLNSNLTITYSACKAQILSNSVGTLAIAKEFLSKQATADRVRMNVSVSLRPSTVTKSLEMMKVMLHKQFEVALERAFIKTLEDLKTHEDDLESFLEPKYMSILKNTKTIENDLKSAATSKAAVIATVMSHYRGLFTLKGHWPESEDKVLDLLTVEKFDFEALKALFAKAI